MSRRSNITADYKQVACGGQHLAMEVFYAY
jgi:hypothetical protein